MALDRSQVAADEVARRSTAAAERPRRVNAAVGGDGKTAQRSDNEQT